MYRVSPLTYLLEGLTVAGLADARIHCSDIEILPVPLPSSSTSAVNGHATTCGQYLQPFIEATGGYVANPSNKEDCQFFPVENVNTLLVGFGMNVHHTWRNVGLLASDVVFNLLARFGLFWVVGVFKRVRC
ncbi:hypothetical protein F5Y08DRAFT_316521 [Xylaria arbuscula]|nr:hypothetical protein F5Y08DRAFT_316521 [Xylaria arbuscula]